MVTNHEKDIIENLVHWKTTSLASMEDWEVREFLSFYIYEQHLSETELTVIKDLMSYHSDILFVNLADIRDKFEDTLVKIFDYCNMHIINFEKIKSVYCEWSKLQRHKDKDILVKNITDSIINNVNIDWSNNQLTIVDEAFIQMNLRNKGIEIKCANLNKFPSNTHDLRPFLYAA